MTKKTSYIAAVAVLAAGQAFAARPVARWDVVPHQRLKEPFKAGVVAFYDKPFYVEFTVNGVELVPDLATRRHCEERYGSCQNCSECLFHNEIDLVNNK